MFPPTDEKRTAAAPLRPEALIVALRSGGGASGAGVGGGADTDAALGASGR